MMQFECYNMNYGQTYTDIYILIFLLIVNFPEIFGNILVGFLL